jgi:hypothetical protein
MEDSKEGPFRSEGHDSPESEWLIPNSECRTFPCPTPWTQRLLGVWVARVRSLPIAASLPTIQLRVQSGGGLTRLLRIRTQ